MNPDNLHPIPEDVANDQRIEAEHRAAMEARLREGFAKFMAEREANGAGLTAEANEMAETILKNVQEAARVAVQDRVTVSLTPRGRVRKNGPCPCGSGVKFKKCCLGKVQSGEMPMPSPKAMRAYMRENKIQ